MGLRTNPSKPSPDSASIEAITEADIETLTSACRLSRTKDMRVALD
jgi:hypothetical protein